MTALQATSIVGRIHPDGAMERIECFTLSTTKKEPMLVYLAGPMRGFDLYNFPAFDSAAAWLREDGYKVISPAELDRDLGFDPATDKATDEFVWSALRRDLTAILRVDMVAVLPGWEASSGCGLEMAVARGVGLPIYELLVDATDDDWCALSALTAEQEALDRATYESDPDEELQRLLAEEQAIDDRIRAPGGSIISGPTNAYVDSGQGWELIGTVDEIRFGNAMLPDAEAYAGTEFVQSATGGVKGSKAQQPHQIPPKALLALGEVYAKGAAKYPDTSPGTPNWSHGYPWSLSFSADQRHQLAWWAGESYDPEDGLHHLLHAAWHCLTLYTWETEGIALEMDDRPAYYRAEGAA